jgi:hypothetical protein
MYHFLEINRHSSSLWSSSRYRHISAPTQPSATEIAENSNSSALTNNLNQDINVEPDVFLNQIKENKFNSHKLDKVSDQLPDQSPLTLNDLSEDISKCEADNSCHETLTCQPLKMLEINPIYEISGNMFQSTIIESLSHSFVYTFRYCLSIMEILMLRELGEILKESDMSVYVFDVALNEMENLDVGDKYGDKSGLIFIKGRVKPFVLNLRAPVGKVENVEKRKMLVESLSKMALNTVSKYLKVEDM